MACEIVKHGSRVPHDFHIPISDRRGVALFAHLIKRAFEHTKAFRVADSGAFEHDGFLVSEINSST
jgi:hypothetical protein